MMREHAGRLDQGSGPAAQPHGGTAPPARHSPELTGKEPRS